MDEETGQQTVVCVPVIVAVESKLPPPSEVAITSVQRETEDLIPMRNLKMDWVPYFDKEDLSLPDHRRKPLAFVLQCNQRREQVAKLPIDRLKEYEYALPFLFIPKLNETFPPVDSEVQVIDSVEGVGVSFTYDWKFDEIEEFVPELIKQYEFKGDHADTLKKLINDKVSLFSLTLSFSLTHTHAHSRPPRIALVLPEYGCNSLVDMVDRQQR